MWPIFFTFLFLVLVIAVAAVVVSRSPRGRTVGGNASSHRRAGELSPPPRGSAPGSMEASPVNNPLDYREDGSIREGDPAWDFMQQVMKGGSGIARQNSDGTWTSEVTPKDDGNKI